MTSTKNSCLQYQIVGEPETSEEETPENINPLEMSVKSLNCQMRALKKELTDNLIAVNCSLLEHTEQLKELLSSNADSKLYRLKLENSDLRKEIKRSTDGMNK